MQVRSRRSHPPQSLPTSIRKKSPRATIIWTRERAQADANTLWESTKSVRESHGAGLSDVEQLDFIRLFSRFARAPRDIPVVTPATSSEADVIEAELYTDQLAAFRKAQGGRMIALLESLSVVKGDAHRKSVANLHLDALCLTDTLPDLPSSYQSSLLSVSPLIPSSPYTEEQESASPLSIHYITSINIIFRPLADHLTSPQRRSITQAQLTTLSILLDAWKRRKNGGKEALHLVYGWDMYSLIAPRARAQGQSSSDYDSTEGYKALLHRSYGELLGRLQPSPSIWFEETIANDPRDVKNLALHLISVLSLTGTPIQALNIWTGIKTVEIPLTPREEIIATGALLEGLFRGGFIEDAQKLVSYAGQLVTAAQSQRDRPDDNQHLSIETILTAIKVAARRGNADRVDNWIARLEAIGYDSGLEGVARRIQARSQQNELKEARKIFDNVDLVRGSRQDRTRLWGALVVAYVRVDDVGGGMEALQSLLNEGLVPSLPLINTLLYGYAARLDLSRTYALFDRISSMNMKPDIVSWGALVTLHSNLRDPESAERAIRDAIGAGLEVDRRIWTTLMNAYAEVGSWEKVLEIYQFLDTNDNLLLRPDIAATNVLIKANVLVAAPAQSILALFRRTIAKGLRPNVQTYTLVMQSLCTAGMMETAEEIFTMMDHPNEQESLLPTPMAIVRPDGFIFSILLQGYLFQKDTTKARACLVEMNARGIRPSSITYGIIVGSYLQRNTTQALNLAKSLAKDFIQQSPLEEDRHTRPTSYDRPFARGQDLLNVFGPIINAYAKRMDAKLAMEYFRQVLTSDVQPSIQLYTSLMDAYRGVSQLESVKYLWNHLHLLVLDTYPSRSPVISTAPVQFPPIDDPTLRRIDPNHCNVLCLPLSVYISALADANSHAEISSVWQTLAGEGFAFDAGNWNALAIALVEHGELERAFWITEYVLCESVDESDVRSAGTGGELEAVTEGGLIDTTLRSPNRIYENRGQEPAIQRRRRTKAIDLITPIATSGALDVTSLLLQSRLTRRSRFWFPHLRLIEALDTALYKLTPAGGRIISRGKWKNHESQLAERFELRLSIEEAAVRRNGLRCHVRTMEAIRVRKESESRNEAALL